MLAVLQHRQATHGVGSVAGVVPLTPLLFATYLTDGQVFAASASAAGLMFFITGSINGHLNRRNQWRSGLETLLVGGAAAGLAFLVGVWFRDLLI